MVMIQKGQLSVYFREKKTNLDNPAKAVIIDI